MEIVTWILLLLSLVASILLLRRRSRLNNGRRPPGPRGWPIIGNILDLGTIPHQTLFKLKPKYGSVLWLRLGSANTLVIQSAEAAAELFKNHDQVFSDRRSPASFTAHNYDQGGISLGRYDRPYWRMLRRLYSTELMVNRRINEVGPIRQKCIDNMISYMERDSAAARGRGETGELDLSHYLFVMSFNLVGNLVLSRDLLDSKSEEGKEFSAAMDKVMEWGTIPNLADFFPALKRWDPQGIKKNMEKDMGRAMRIISGFVKERIEERKQGKEKTTNDFLDVLLQHQSEGKDGVDDLTDHNLVIFILEMFFAGSETNSTTIEWAMAELLHKPELMRKAKEELDRVVGTRRIVKENDVDDMPYLQAVVKETLRLHPPAPLLLPRNSMEETNFMGYVIPKGTQIWVNVWAIGRDSDAWEDPLVFNPERFLGSTIDYKGQNFELLPFGSGRRICVGLALAHKVLHLALATLLHRFDWELSASTEDLDMNEKMGILIRKLQSLKAIPKRILVAENEREY